MRNHAAAFTTIAAAAVLDVTMGVLFAAVEHIPVTAGTYWAVTTATTVGYGDITPHTHTGRLIAVVVMLTVVPLFGATFSLFTSSLASVHVRKSEARLKDHIMAGNQIAADLYHRHTGNPHPNAPAE